MNHRLARFRVVALLALAAVITGCATGPKFAETSSSMPAVTSGEGRIFFYRSNSMVGAAIQPDVRLNGVVVGPSKPGGFFYVDRPAGSYVASSSTETEKTLSFTLQPGETKYIKMTPGFGVVVGRMVLSVEPAQTARTELASMSYVGATK